MAEDARRTMQLLADESGGTFYTTANLDSLNEVYERVLEDVGRVYSLGYQPKNDKRDGTWRSIRVEIPDHPELKVRSRSGYYAR
jgi:VWFA-related protein